MCLLYLKANKRDLIVKEKHPSLWCINTFVFYREEYLCSIVPLVNITSFYFRFSGFNYSGFPVLYFLNPSTCGASILRSIQGRRYRLDVRSSTTEV